MPPMSFIVKAKRAAKIRFSAEITKKSPSFLIANALEANDQRASNGFAEGGAWTRINTNSTNLFFAIFGFKELFNQKNTKTDESEIGVREVIHASPNINCAPSQCSARSLILCRGSCDVRETLLFFNWQGNQIHRISNWARMCKCSFLHMNIVYLHLAYLTPQHKLQDFRYHTDMSPPSQPSSLSVSRIAFSSSSCLLISGAKLV